MAVVKDLTNCLAYVTKMEMWRHAQTCPWNEKHENDALRNSELLIYPSTYSQGATEELKGLANSSISFNIS